MKQVLPSCSICGGPSRVEHSWACLNVRQCGHCGHREAEHPGTRPEIDYHKQYTGESYTDTLKRTRKRQALLLLELLRKHCGSVDRLLDFGSGRGWFLETCKSEGVTRLAGADTSLLAVETLHAHGIEAVQSDTNMHAVGKILGSLSFHPQIVTLLDVCEHFEGVSAISLLSELINGLKESPLWILIKVPSSDGLFFKLAQTLARAGIQGPLKQLYQVGTHPPHCHYFSNRSLQILCERMDLQIVDELGDLDLERDALADRVQALKLLPRPMGRWIGSGLCTWASRTGSYDSRVVLASRKPA